MEEEMMLKIMTCDGVFFEGSVSVVEFPSREGRMGVQKGHMPLTVLLDRGEIVIRERQTARSAEGEAGFAVITGTETVIWTRKASWLS